jgi:hypothetical protein
VGRQHRRGAAAADGKGGSAAGAPGRPEERARDARDQGEEPAPGGPSFLQARTANEVLEAQEGKLRLSRLKGELMIDRARATAQVFTLARQERDAWVQWPARVAADLAAELGIETHTVQTALEAAVKAQLAELTELKSRID